jgi:CBS domain containing-hemolysin-like protein
MELLAALLIGNTIVNVAIAAVGFSLAERLLPGHGEQISIPVITVLLVIFGEAGPKRLGLLFSETLATLNSRMVPLLIFVTRPLRRTMERVTRVFEPLLIPRGRTLSEEEFDAVLDISREQGIINADELAMVKAIIHLEDLRASNVMTPRVDMIGCDLADDPARFVGAAAAAKRNFLVLYRDQPDNVEGFLDVRKFLLDPEHRVEAARVPPFFVPGNAPLTRLLAQFQRERRRIAVVVDEYGGVAGLLTRGDILEAITGDIYDELSKPRPVFQQAGPHCWLVDANIPLDELNRRLRLHLEAEGADRLAGWITAHAGHVPQADDVVEAQGCRVTVAQTIRQRVTLAEIEKLEPMP